MMLLLSIATCKQGVNDLSNLLLSGLLQSQTAKAEEEGQADPARLIIPTLHALILP